MPLPYRSLLERELRQLNDNLLRLASMVEEAIEQAMDALINRNVALAQTIIQQDQQINNLRYDIERECLQILATQHPAASDLRAVIAAMHIAVELERMGDHAAGTASLVERMENDAELDSLHQLPKMANRAMEMTRMALQAYLTHDGDLASKIIARDDKLDKHYHKLFLMAIKDMRDDGSYIRRATFLLWAGHNLERIGDRATNIAERVLFMITGTLDQEE